MIVDSDAHKGQQRVDHYFFARPLGEMKLSVMVTLGGRHPQAVVLADANAIAARLNMGQLCFGGCTYVSGRSNGDALMK